VVKTMALTHRALDGRQYFHELAEELAHELDYSREGRLAREFARASAACETSSSRRSSTSAPAPAF
jgi:predicted unusual protein kinase regulating ubiquinone biosynthesis (AarF/ABC1/UbiB family)